MDGVCLLTSPTPSIASRQRGRELVLRFVTAGEVFVELAATSFSGPAHSLGSAALVSQRTRISWLRRNRQRSKLQKWQPSIS
jgi:hypothetical protein